MKQLPKSMEKFMNNISPKKQEHNLYFIQCEDRDGNITEEKFGINLMTDYGFNRKYVTNINSTTKFVMGTGTGTPSCSDTEMFEEIVLPGNQGQITVTANNSRYSSFFNKETKMIIGRKFTGTVVLDYNYSWLTSDVNVTEFGEYDGNNYSDRKKSLLTHAMVYDEDGNPSYFTKRMNEKTTIFIFKTCCINSDVINNLYEKGIYLFAYPSSMVCPLSGNYYNYHILQTSYYFSGKCCHHDDYPLYPVPLVDNSKNEPTEMRRTNHYYNSGFGPNGSCTISSRPSYSAYRFDVNTENGYRTNIPSGDAITTSKYYCQTGLFVSSNYTLSQYRYRQYGYYNIDGLFMMEKMNLKEPEELVSEYIWTDDFMTPRFRNAFNMAVLNYQSLNDYYFMKQTGLPVNDFNITSVKLYNALTNEYDIEEEFVNDPDYDFRNPERAINGFYSDKSFGSYNVMVNINTNVPIIAFREQYGRKIYATDEYWNPDTFQIIEDHDNVPKELQNKRYYIKTPSETDPQNQYDPIGTGFLMYPVRESNKHALVPSKEIRELKTETNLYFRHTGYSNGKFMYGSDNGWIYIDGYVVYPDSQDENGNSYVYDVKYPEDSSGYLDEYWRHYMNSYNDDVVVLMDCAYHSSNTDVRMRIIKPDPTNPLVEPSYKDYKYANIFNTTKNPYSNGRSPEKFYTRFEKTYGLLYIYQANWVYYIDTTSEDMVSNEIPFQIRAFSPVYDTELFVTRTMDNSSYTFNIYNIRSLDEPVATFELVSEGLEGCYGCFGYHDKIYIQMKKSGSWELFTYDITYGDIKSYYNVRVAPFGTDYYSYEYVNTFYCDYDDEAIIVKTNSDDNCCRSVLIFKNNTDEIIYLGDQSPSNSQYYYSCIYIPYGAFIIKKLNVGKNYVCIAPGNYNITADVNVAAHSACNMIIDIGKIRNRSYRNQKDIRNNCCSPILHMPPPLYDGLLDNFYSVMCFYKDMVAIAFSSGFNKNITLIPIEMFLPHKVTGTTKTIQSYNNPKKINAKQFGVEVKYK